MRNKLFSAFLCGILLTGIITPISFPNGEYSSTNSSPIHEFQTSSGLNTWNHDCTNLTGFTDITDSSWFYPFNSSDTIVSGDIGVGTSWIQANDVGSGSGWHGPVKAIPLSDPFKISELMRFDARIGFDSSVGSQLGAIRVMLHDSNQRVISQFNIFDSWADDKQLKMPFHWAFLNGSYTGTPWSEPDWVTFAPYDETLTMLQNSTGFYAIIPEIGNFRLNVGPTDALDRVVSYVSVWFAGNDGYSFCDSVYLHSVSLEWTPQAEDPHTTWHHDGSNTTGFVRDPDWNKPGWNTWVHSDGNLISSGDYIQFSGIPSASGWHGPVFVYDLGHTFKLSTLTNFSITLDVDNTVAAQLGRVYVTLADENGIGSVGNSVYDYLAGSSRGMYTCGYRRLNTTVTSHGAPDPTSFSSVTGKFMMWVQDGEMMSEVPGYGQASLGPLETAEGQREIRYVVMTYGRFDSDPIMDVRIEDIYLEYTPTSYFGGSWHHDGSNMTAFDGVGDDSWLWAHSTPDLLTTAGTLNSSGQYIYSEDLGTPPVERSWFGPMWYHTLETPFQFSRFGTLDVEFEINPSGVSGATGGVFVTLHDDSGLPIIKVQVRDPYIATTEVMPTASWHFANGTTMVPGPGVLVSSPYHQTISIELNATGLYANLPGVGEGLISEYDDLEDRQVSYVSIWIAGSKEASSPPWPHTDIVRVHDIRMTWHSDSPVSSINHPGDLEFESGMTGNDVVWNLSTEIGALYIIYLDYAVIDSGTYDGQPLSVNVDAYSFGVHNLTVWCDTTGGVLTDLVWVTIHPSTTPTIDSPPDVEYEVGAVGNYITWNPFDLYPAAYVISIDVFPVIVDLWTGSSITINVDGHPIGEYAYDLIVFDLAGNMMNDTVNVIVTDIISDLLAIDSPADTTFEYGTTGHNITWSPSSTLPSSFELYVNGVLTDSGSWDGSQIMVDLDTLSVGIYNYTLSVSNTLGDSVYDQVLVAVTGQTDDGNLTIIVIGAGSLLVIVVIVGAICRGRGGVGPPPASPSAYDW